MTEKEKDNEIDILLKSKILKEDITLKQLMEVTKSLEALPAGPGDGPDKAAQWAIIVKGKWVVCGPNKR